MPNTDLDSGSIVGVNLKGAYLVGKYTIPEIIKAGSSAVVITGSVNSFVADRQWAAYCATKGGVLMLAKAMALDHAPDGVRVNCVCPDRWTPRCRNAGSGPAPQPYEEAVAADRPPIRWGATRAQEVAGRRCSCPATIRLHHRFGCEVDGGLTAQ